MSEVIERAQWRAARTSNTSVVELPPFEGEGRLLARAFWSASTASADVRLAAGAAELQPRFYDRDERSLRFEFEGAELRGHPLTVNCARPPDLLIWTWLTESANLASRLVLPRSFTIARERRDAGDEPDIVSIRLAMGDLAGALEGFAELCLTGLDRRAADAARLVLSYLREHPLHRDDRVGLFAAAIGGLGNAG